MIEDGGTSWRLHAHAIVSAEGNIAAADGTMPPDLIVEPDQRRFQAALDAAALTVLGREGHELHPPKGRRRLVMTSRVEGIEREGEAVTFWNPAGATLMDALRAASPGGGVVAVAGGTRVMTALLPALDRFELVVAPECRLPDGRPCFEGASSLGEIEARIEDAGLAWAATIQIDDHAYLRLFERPAGARGLGR